MGMSQNGKMMECPKMINISKNGKNDGNFQKRKNTGIFRKLNKCWKFPKIKYIGGISSIGVDSGNWLNADNSLISTKWLISGTRVGSGTQ